MTKNIKRDQKTPSLRFPGFSGEWDKKILLSVAEFYSGGTPKSTNRQYYQGTIPFIKSGEISRKTVEQYITEEALESCSAKMVESGDLLYALYGATSGEVAISKISGAINQAILCIRTDQNKDWLLNYLKHNKAKIISKYLQGGQGNLSADIIKKLEVFFPSKEEQQKIASFLSTVDSWLDNLRSQKSSLESYKKSIMQKIFLQEIRFKDENGKNYPEWEEKRILEITNDHDNMRKPISSEKRISGSYPYYGANGVVDFVENYIFDGEYVLVAEDGVVDTTKYPIHLVNGKFWVNNHAHVLSGKNISTHFLYFALANVRFMKFITGSAQTKLNGQVLKKISIKVPTIDEQQKISDFLTSIDKSIDSKEKEITLTEQWKNGLTQRIFL